MASLDKASVREEVARLKADFEKPSSQGKVSPETGALFKSLLLIVEPILSIFLEKQNRKTSKNSSLPSSQTGKDKTSLSRGAAVSKRSLDNQTVTKHRSIVRQRRWRDDPRSACGCPGLGGNSWSPMR